MELSNEFEVPVPMDQAWEILTDLERIAPCLPGAQLQEVEGETYRGIVKIKVGPITAQYKGQAVIVQQDDEAHRVLLEATGRDTKGAGNATANVSAQLTARGDVTHVSVLTDLTVTGKVAQFGRGVLADVSAKLLDQFARNLESMVIADELVTDAVILEVAAITSDNAIEALAAEAAAGVVLSAAVDMAATIEHPDVAGADSPTFRRIESPEPEAVDLLDAAGSPVVKRLLPLLGLVAVVLALVALRRRRRRRSR
jgi:carbon monoxide dehydrogenase subunit G